MNNPNENIDDVLAEADKLAAEVEAEVAQMNTIGQLGELEGLDQIPPELLEHLSPEQIMEILAAQAAGKRKPQAYYTRKQTPKAVRRAKARAQRAARKVTRRKGWGRTISRRKRMKKAA